MKVSHTEIEGLIIKGNIYINVKDLDKIQTIVNKHTMTSAKENPLFAKVAYSQYQFLNDLAEWRSISQPFSHGRNFATPNLDELKACAK